MSYSIIHKMALSILILGLINIYNIIKEGIIIYLVDNNINEKVLILEKGIIKIDINVIKILIFLTIILFIIFYVNPITTKINETLNNYFKVEYFLILGLGIIGILLLLISNDLIFLFLSLELYSFSIYFLILVKDTIMLRRISIFYFIISSLSSALLLLTFSKLYKEYGTLNIENIFELFSLYNFEETETFLTNSKIYLIYLIFIVFIFKLGVGPFVFWLIRVYADLEKKILFYQLIIPKLFFFILLLKFLPFTYIKFESLNYSIYILAIISIIYGTIGGLFQTKDNILLSYSSILNFGYILLILSIILINYPIISFNIILNEINDKIWLIFQYFFIYIFNLLGIFSVLFLYRRTSNINAFNSFFLQPFFFISFFILILSLIGMPPFSGFFSKFYLFFSLFSFNTLSTITLIIFICSTLISSFFYFKFIFASSSDNTIINTIEKIKDNMTIPILNSTIPNFYSFLLSFSTLFTILYAFFLSSFYPFFILSFC